MTKVDKDKANWVASAQAAYAQFLAAQGVEADALDAYEGLLASPGVSEARAALAEAERLVDEAWERYEESFPVSLQP